MITLEDHVITVEDHVITLEDHVITLEDHVITLEDHGDSWSMRVLHEPMNEDSTVYMDP